MATYQGSCHCGRVRFEITAPERPVLHDCNCSICRRSGFLHLFVGRDDFRLIEGADALTTYRFNTGTAKHQFCATCGIKSFYVPRSHPDGYSVNARCLDGLDIASLEIRPFDGANWEAAVAALRGEG